MLKELVATKPPRYRNQNCLNSGLPDDLGNSARSLLDSFSKRNIFIQLQIELLLGQLPKIFHNRTKRMLTCSLC